MEVDAIGDAFAGEAFASVIKLGFGDGDGGDAATVVADGVGGKSAPTAADFEEMIGGLELEFAAKGVVFGGLCGLEGLVGVGEKGGGIGHRGIEPNLVEVVAEIVVFGDVLAGGVEAIGAEDVEGAVVALEEVEGELAGFGTGHGGGVFDIENRPSDDAFDVGGLPVAIDETFAEADIPEEHAFLEKAGVKDVNLGDDRGVWGADDLGEAVGEGEFEAPRVHFGEGGEDEALVEATGGSGRLGESGGGVVGGEWVHEDFSRREA